MSDATEFYDVVLTEVFKNLREGPANTKSSCGTILKEIIGLDVKPKFVCGCKKEFEKEKNADQYITYIFAQDLVQIVNIDHKATVNEIYDKILEFNQKFGLCAKKSLEHSLVFKDDEHVRKCKKTEEAICVMSTDKEPEVLCIDLRWSRSSPFEILSVFNLISNSMHLSDLYELDGQDD